MRRYHDKGLVSEWCRCGAKSKFGWMGVYWGVHPHSDERAWCRRCAAITPRQMRRYHVKGLVSEWCRCGAKSKFGWMGVYWGVHPHSDERAWCRRCAAITPRQMRRYHVKGLVSEWCRCGTSQKRVPRDSTKAYRPWYSTFWDVPQMCRYHTKLRQVS